MNVFFFFSFFSFRFSFGFSFDFFFCSLLPLSFFPLPLMAVSPLLFGTCFWIPYPARTVKPTPSCLPPRGEVSCPVLETSIDFLSFYPNSQFSFTALGGRTGWGSQLSSRSIL